MINGVLPVPPTAMLPTITTGTSARYRRSSRIRYIPRRIKPSRQNNSVTGNSNQATGLCLYQNAGAELMSHGRVSYALVRLVLIELHLVQIGIVRTFHHQFIMGTTFDDPAFIHHHDDIGILDGGQSVRDDQRGTILHQGLE